MICETYRGIQSEDDNTDFSFKAGHKLNVLGYTKLTRNGKTKTTWSGPRPDQMTVLAQKSLVKKVSKWSFAIQAVHFTSASILLGFIFV